MGGVCGRMVRVWGSAYGRVVWLRKRGWRERVCVGECVGEDGAGVYAGLGEGGAWEYVVLETECGRGGTANIKCVHVQVCMHTCNSILNQPMHRLSCTMPCFPKADKKSQNVANMSEERKEVSRPGRYHSSSRGNNGMRSMHVI